MTDDELMAAALVAADTARFDVAPRPWVGAALAALDGTVVTGATTGRTGPHAEVAALEAAASAGVDVVGASPCGQASCSRGSSRTMSASRAKVDSAPAVNATSGIWNRRE